MSFLIVNTSVNNIDYFFFILQRVFFSLFTNTLLQSYHWVDRTNQELAYYNSEQRSVRKQNRLVDHFFEMYCLVNGHTLWLNADNLSSNLNRRDQSSSEFRFKVSSCILASLHGKYFSINSSSISSYGRKISHSTFTYL